VGLLPELVSIGQVDISVTGMKSKVELLKPEQLKPFVDVSAFEEPGVYNVDIGCWLSVQGVEIKNIYPPKVQVKITRDSKPAE
jgi:hypothetical protein